MKTSVKVANLFKEEVLTTLDDVILTRDTAGGYLFFNRYLVVRTNGGVYAVTDAITKEHFEFSSLKIATAWCTLHKTKKWKEARRVQVLDMRLSSCMNDIVNQRRLLRQQNNGNRRLIHLNKLQEEFFRRNQMNVEINHYINSSKQIQNASFAKRLKLAKGR